MSDQKASTKRQYVMSQAVYPRPYSSFIEPAKLAGQQPTMHMAPAQPGLNLYMHLVCCALQGTAGKSNSLIPNTRDEQVETFPVKYGPQEANAVVDNAFQIADAVIDRMLLLSTPIDKDNHQ
jgi:hypothetical protein